MELKAKNWRSAKERDYINAAGVRLELGRDSLALLNDRDAKMTPAARMLALAAKEFGTARKVLPM
jgi:hypothetical protein